MYVSVVITPNASPASLDLLNDFADFNASAIAVSEDVKSPLQELQQLRMEQEKVEEALVEEADMTERAFACILYTKGELTKRRDR